MYTINGTGTGYSATGTFTTTNIPTITTPTAAGITPTSAILGGDLASNNGAAVTSLGVVYAPTATNPNPQIGGAGVTNITGTATSGVFTVNASDLTPNTAYTFAAYATNSVGTGYSATGTFTTAQLPAVAWLNAYGLSPTANLLSVPNNDGVPLLLSYALNLDPTKNQSANLPQAVCSGNQLSLTFYAGNRDVSYAAQASSDLQNWSGNGMPSSPPRTPITTAQQRCPSAAAVASCAWW